MHIDPQRSQFEAFKNLDRDQPVCMLNLVRLNEDVVYPDGERTSGTEAYRRYGEASAPIFTEVGGEILFSGSPQNVLIGPLDEAWDIAFIAKYPAANAFLAMVTDARYRAIVHHRQLAVADSRLIRLAERSGGRAFG
ncbi:MAG: DUF1330 domain-containing protein [Pseudomonadota bacterium]